MEEESTTEDTKPPLELLDFWAVWCGPCKIMAPILEELEQEYKDKLAIRKFNVDEAENQALVDKYNVMSIPTYILQKDGETVATFIGVQTKNTLDEKIKSLLEA